MIYNEDDGCGFEYFSGDYIYEDLYTPEDCMDERWWFINDAPGYMVSDCGRVWSSKTQQFLKVKPMDNHGHMGVCMCVDGKRVYKYIHRLMAEAFIPNPKGFPVVRHLNDNPGDNWLENLAWGTQRDNMRDCINNGNAHFVTPEEREIGLARCRTPIIAIDIETGVRREFAGQGEAARMLGLQQANIWKVLNGHRPSTCGYTFEYVNRGGAA